MCTVMHIIPNLAQGGAEKVMVDVVRNIAARHVVVTLETMQDFYSLSPHVRHYRLGVPHKRRHSRVHRFMATAAFPVILLRERPTCVVGWSFVGHVVAASLSRYFGLRAVWSIHCPVSDDVLDNADNKPRMATYARLSPHVHAVHYPTERTREQFERRGVTAPAHVLRHFIDGAAP